MVPVPIARDNFVHTTSGPSSSSLPSASCLAAGTRMSFRDMATRSSKFRRASPVVVVLVVVVVVGGSGGGNER